MEESEAFFEALDARPFDANVLRLLIDAQLHSYFQIVKEGYERDAARDAMRTLMRYHMGGWTALLSADNARKGGEK